MLRQHGSQSDPEVGVVRSPGREVGYPGPEADHGSERDDRGGQALRDRLQHALVVRAGAVDLVHEDERRHA